MSLAVPTAAGFFSGTGKLGLFLPLLFLCGAALPFFLGSLGRYRPKHERWVILPCIVLFIAMGLPASIGGHSLWLSVFGEAVHCRVDNIQRHPSSRGSDSFSAELLCGDRKLTFFPTKFRNVELVGTELDIVVDRTGLFSSVESDQVSWWRTLLLLVGPLMAAAFMLLVARLPLREPVSAAAKESG